MPVKAKKRKLKDPTSRKIPHSKPKRIPRQRQLPGVEDSKIAAIENAALDYAEIRDHRQELTKQESDLKQSLLKLMHKLKKTEYRRDGILVLLQVEQETVKVRVRDSGEDKEAKPEEQPPVQAQDEDEEEETESEAPDVEDEEEEQEQPDGEAAKEDTPF